MGFYCVPQAPIRSCFIFASSLKLGNGFKDSMLQEPALVGEDNDGSSLHHSTVLGFDCFYDKHHQFMHLNAEWNLFLSFLQQAS